MGDYSELPDCWAKQIGPTAADAKVFLDQLHPINGDRKIYPARSQVFRAFHETPYDKVRVVILGQDPYYDSPGKSDGLAFSMSDGPPVDSLKNILISLKQDMPGFKMPGHGDLSPWAKQGVFLFNTALTVPEGLPGEHLSIWNDFTNSVLHSLNRRVAPIVFVFLGIKAIKRGERLPIDRKKHHVIEATHPRSGAKWKSKSFAEFHVFKLINDWFDSRRETKIDWTL